MKILIVEDEKELAKDIAKYLAGENYICEIASNFIEATEKISLYEYDCILLDLMLPDGDGMQLLNLIRQQNKAEGVIILSAKNSTEDKVDGLKSGADDYLSKPFYHAELQARVHSIIRRKQFKGTDKIIQNEITIDLNAKSVFVGNQAVILTKKEFDLLLFLVGNKNRVLSKGALAEHLSGDIADMFDNQDFIYAHIKNLKKKLSDAGYGNYIKTIYATGYKWEI
ncbi:MAG: response regulator transcription factor [Bacteroidia bacterium]